MNLGIEKRIALVVGASRGIGLEVARELRAEGCEVQPVSRTHGYDLMTDEGLERLLATIGPPDIIVHVMGGSQGRTKTLSSSRDWEQVWRLNLGVAHDINRHYIPMMQRNKWGRIIHLSSNATRIPTGYAPYTSAKAALEGYIRIVGNEFSKDGIIITGVAPGIIHTPGRYWASLDSKAQEEYFNKYLPIGRFGRAEEVAKAVAFLASDHSAYMAGSILQMDGGAR